MFKKNQNTKWKSSSTRTWGHAAEDQKQIWTSNWWINHPGAAHMKFYSRDWLIQSIMLDKNNKGEVRGLIGDRRHIWGGALIEDLRVLIFIFTCDSSWQWKWGIQWHSLFCNIVFRTMLMIHLLITVQPKTKWMAIMKMRLCEWHYMYFALLLCLYIISART